MAFTVGKFLFGILFIIFSFSSVKSVEEVVVRHAPESIKFVSNDPVRSSYMGDIFSSMLGFTIRSNIEWHSLAEVTPWKRPDAIVVFELLGFDNKVDLPLDGNKFLLENTGDLDNQYDLLSHRTNERFFGKSPVMLHMDLNDELHDAKITQPVILKSVPADPKKRLQIALDDPELGKLVKDSTFNISHPSDIQLLTEFATAKEFFKALSEHKAEIHDGAPDIYWVKIGGLENIVAFYGAESIQFHEALRLLRQIISEGERTMRHIYDDNVVFVVIKTNSLALPLGHKSRRLLVLDAKTESKKEPMDEQYDPNFPVAFLMIAVVVIIMAMAVFSVSMVMWNLDPGKDSIIYRMTSQRMKVD